jgi:hypothetical protein
MSGDAPPASPAAAQAAALDPGVKSENLQLAALSAAANDEAEAARGYLAALAAAFPEAAQEAATRVEELPQTGALDALPTAGEAEPGSAEGPDPILLDVAIILSQNTHRERTGLNLRDGLSLQYGSSRNSTRTITRERGTQLGNSYQRVLTASISIPQTNYNLNLFKTAGGNITRWSHGRSWPPRCAQRSCRQPRAAVNRGDRSDQQCRSDHSEARAQPLLHADAALQSVKHLPRHPSGSRADDGRVAYPEPELTARSASSRSGSDTGLSSKRQPLPAISLAVVAVASPLITTIPAPGACSRTSATPRAPLSSAPRCQSVITAEGHTLQPAPRRPHRRWRTGPP